MSNNNTKSDRSAATMSGASTGFRGVLASGDALSGNKGQAGLNATAGRSSCLPSRPDTVGWPTSTYHLVQYGNGDFEHDGSRDLGKRPDKVHAKYHDEKMSQFCHWMPIDHPDIKDLTILTEATRKLASELCEKSTLLEVSDQKFEPGHAESDATSYVTLRVMDNESTAQLKLWNPLQEKVGRVLQGFALVKTFDKM